MDQLERKACEAVEPRFVDFNKHAKIPFGCQPTHIHEAMCEFTSFLAFINTQLHTRGTPRLESLLMPANFSSIVGEFMGGHDPEALRYSRKKRLPQRPS